MDIGEFLGVTATHNPQRWYMPITNGVATGERFMFGGCGLGAAILAMERTTGRNVVWATGQYLSFAKVGEIMDLDVTVAVSGRYTAQARVIGSVGGRGDEQSAESDEGERSELLHGKDSPEWSVL